MHSYVLGGTKTSATHRHDHSWRQRVRHSAQVGIIIIVILITMVVTPPSSSWSVSPLSSCWPTKARIVGYGTSMSSLDQDVLLSGGHWCYQNNHPPTRSYDDGDQQSIVMMELMLMMLMIWCCLWWSPRRQLAPASAPPWQCWTRALTVAIGTISQPQGVMQLCIDASM